ncbi:MAG: hypothetical protein IJ532_08330 [Alphaproteobacteria bacterium]|nr:hypothetical protein [Alphaproteobacteria bacterium]
MANSIDNAIYSPNSAVFQTKYNQNQALVNSAGNKLDMGFVSVNPSKLNQNVIKSDYQIKIDDLYRKQTGNWIKFINQAHQKWRAFFKRLKFFHII